MHVPKRHSIAVLCTLLFVTTSRAGVTTKCLSQNSLGEADFRGKLPILTGFGMGSKRIEP
jgi:hypothetical protein